MWLPSLGASRRTLYMSCNTIKLNSLQQPRRPWRPTSYSCLCHPHPWERPHANSQPPRSNGLGVYSPQQQQYDLQGGGERSERWGIPESEASLPPESSQVVAEGWSCLKDDHLRPSENRSSIRPPRFFEVTAAIRGSWRPLPKIRTPRPFEAV